MPSSSPDIFGKLIFLFRHADKQASTGNNPGLSKSGLSQAENLRILCLDKKIPAPKKIWVSPKIRTKESMLAVANHFDVPCEIVSELSERNRQESRNEFEARIQKVLHLASAEKGPLYICTHYDWLEEGVPLIPVPDSDPVITGFSWHPLSYLAFEVIEDRWHFFKKGQVLP